MLDNHPRHQLRFIIEKYGRSIIENPRRCRGMLKDLAPKNTRETNLLMLALDNHIVAALIQKTHTPLSIHLDGLAQRLHNNFGTQKEFAFWAVESWALALDVIQSPLAHKIEPEKIIIPQQKIGKFIVQDGIATDTETGLMWLRFACGQQWENGKVIGESKKIDWNSAMKNAQVFNRQGYASFNDWRVPNIDELKTLIDKVKGTSGNYIDADVFPKSDKFFWSSSSCDNMTKSNRVWFVYFNNGHSATDYKNGSNCVRLVRG